MGAVMSARFACRGLLAVDSRDLPWLTVACPRLPWRLTDCCRAPMAPRVPVGVRWQAKAVLVQQAPPIRPRFALSLPRLSPKSVHRASKRLP